MKNEEANSNPGSYIGWAENQHFSCILYPPIRAQNTENAGKSKKSQLQMFHVKHLYTKLQTPLWTTTP